MKIAISGKGGVGKTTTASLLAQAFARRGFKVIAIDADPDSNLAGALGFPPDLRITPLAEMKELILERVGAEPGKPSFFYTLNPKVDDIPEKFAVRNGNIRLMIMGTIRRGGSGCACPEHVIIKGLISHLLVERDEVVILDMEAGIEHLTRGTAQYVDALVCVVQPAAASIQTFGRIKQLAADLKIARVGIVANMVRTPEDARRIAVETGVEPWCILPFSPAMADYTGGEVDATIRAQIDRLVVALESIEPGHQK